MIKLYGASKANVNHLNRSEELSRDIGIGEGDRLGIYRIIDGSIVCGDVRRMSDLITPYTENMKIVTYENGDLLVNVGGTYNRTTVTWRVFPLESHDSVGNKVRDSIDYNFETGKGRSLPEDTLIRYVGRLWL